MWDKINNAVPALGYSLRTTEAPGWKTNAQDEEGNEGRWVTMHGTPVFIKDGEDPKAAMSRTFAKDKPRGTERPRPKQPGAFKRWWREVVSDAKASFRKRHPQQETQKTQPTGGEVPNAALRHFPRQVDMVFDGKLSSQQVVDGLMKSGMIRTGTASRELTRARYVKEFDKAVLLLEQQEEARQSPGGGKNAYTDKGEKAKLRKGQSLAEKFFAPHIDQLADGMMSVTSKVDELARRGELGVMPGEPGFIKLRETVIKDFTKALNRRETLDRRYEKQRLKTDKPKKLTKREQQAAWVPSEEELAASGPVIGTGWKRNMAENQPRDKDGKWTDGGAAEVTDYLEDPKVAMTDVDKEIEDMDEAGTGDPDNRRYDALNHISMVLQINVDAPLSQRQWQRFAYSVKDGRVVAAGRLHYDKAKKTAELTDLGSVEKGEGRKVLDLLVRRAKSDGVGKIWLISTGGKFYTDYGFTSMGGSRVELDLSKFKTNAFDPAQPRDEAGKWALSGSKLAGALTSLYGAQPTPPADGKGWLRPDGLFIDGGGVSHVAMLRAAYDDRKGKAPAFAEDMYRLAFRAGMARYDRHAGVIEISGTPTEDQKTALRKMFDGLGTFDEIEVEVFRTPETRYYSEQDRESHRRWMETSPDSMVEKVDAFYGSKGDGYVSPLAAFRGNAFDPNQPRDEDGKWTGGTLSFKGEPEKVGAFTKDVAVRRSTVTGPDGKPVMTWHNPDGSQITDPKLVARAEQLNGTMATAPNVKGAWLNPDTESPLLAIAFDAKDRKQYIYSREFVQKNAEAKFKIVEQMEKDLPVMRKQAAVDRKAGTPEAFLFKLEDMTCIRVGSDRDTGAEKKAYGLTTLRGEHVKVEGDLIKLEFPAKGGKSGSYAVKDRELATFITERKAANGDGPLWPDVTAGKFNAYLKGLDPTTNTPVTAHKFRHYHATRIAAEVVARYEGKELSPKAFTRVQKEACEKAAAHLSNTWTVTREKYVNPTVWGRLTVKAG